MPGFFGQNAGALNLIAQVTTPNLGLGQVSWEPCTPFWPMHPFTTTRRRSVCLPVTGRPR